MIAILFPREAFSDFDLDVLIAFARTSHTLFVFLFLLPYCHFPL